MNLDQVKERVRQHLSFLSSNAAGHRTSDAVWHRILDIERGVWDGVGEQVSLPIKERIKQILKKEKEQ